MLCNRKMKKALMLLLPLVFGAINNAFADEESEKREKLKQFLHQQCDFYGFLKGTDSYANCVQNELTKLQQGMASRQSLAACKEKAEGIRERVYQCKQRCYANATFVGDAGFNNCFAGCDRQLNMLPSDC